MKTKSVKRYCKVCGKITTHTRLNQHQLECSVCYTVHREKGKERKGKKDDNKMV